MAEGGRSEPAIAFMGRARVADGALSEPAIGFTGRPLEADVERSDGADVLRFGGVSLENPGIVAGILDLTRGDTPLLLGRSVTLGLCFGLVVLGPIFEEAWFGFMGFAEIEGKFDFWLVSGVG